MQTIKGNVSGKQPIIIISGFGWSGSGVLVDILREHPQVQVTGGDELIFFWLFDKLVGKARERKKISLLGEEETLFCAKIPDTFTSEKQEQYEKTFSAYFQAVPENREAYTKVAESLVADLVLQSERLGKTPFDEGLEGILSGKLLETLDSLLQIDPSKLYIYDNLLHPQQLSLLRYMTCKDSREIWICCIDRDARDQFYEQYERYASGLGQWHTLKVRQKIMTAFAKSGFFRVLLGTSLVKMFAAVVFIQMHLKKREAFNQAIENLQVQPNVKVIPLRFESLVLDEKGQREQLLESILEKKGFSVNEIERGKYFIPAESKRNIGKFQKDPAQKVYSVIERKLHTYCHHADNGNSKTAKQ